MKLFFQLFPLAPTLLMLASTIFLIRIMIHRAPPEEWSNYQKNKPLLFPPRQKTNVSFKERTARYLVYATAAIAAVRPVWPGLWLFVTQQMATLRAQLDSCSDRARTRYPLLPHDFVPSGHHQPSSPMIAVDLTYTVVAHMDITTKPGELETQMHGVEVEYFHDLPSDHWRDGDTLTPEGINALMMGFVNGLMCTIRLGEQQNGMDGAALFRESLDMMQQLFIAQGTATPVTDLKR